MQLFRRLPVRPFLPIRPRLVPRNCIPPFRLFSVIPPKPRVKDWSTQEVLEWARQIPGVEEEDIQKLKLQRLTGSHIFDINEERLKDCGLPLGPRITILKEIEKLRLESGIIFSNVGKDERKKQLENLEWRPPKKLSNTFGVDWPYQENEENLNLISEALESHYKFWREKNTDKQRHPLFLALSGAGTGKSRLLDEFPSLCKEAVHQAHLQERLRNAFVFNLSFENGTLAEGDETKGAVEIGIRMLYQLIGHENFSEIRSQYTVTSHEVIKCLARSLGKNESELTIIICVDGVQKLDHLPRRKSTPFYGVIAHLARLANASEAFVIPICSATISVPVEEVLSDSPQRRVFLKVPPLDPSKIIENPSRLLSFLMNDMGGHGRALECLLETWQSYFSQDFSLIEIMYEVRRKLYQCYPDWRSQYRWLEPILSLVVSRRIVYLDTIVEGSTVDSLCGLGLLSYNISSKCLECPFIWVWLLAEDSKNSFIRDLVFGKYSHIEKRYLGTSYYTPTTWEQWESFNAQYRCLKSRVYPDDQNVSFFDFHNGALFSDTLQDFEFRNKHLTLARSKQRFHTGNDDIVECKEGKKVISEGKHFFLAAPGNDSGDGCCALFINDKVTIREAHQYKLITKSSLTKSNYIEERRKSTKSDDICMFFTADKADWKRTDLPERSGMIKISNSLHYYGPWSARIYFLFNEQLNLNVNTMTNDQLQEVPGIGPKRAELIVKLREEKKFESIEECASRTHISSTFLLPLNCE